MKITTKNLTCVVSKDRFKMKAARDGGVNLKQGYNGDLTSKEAGSVGGQMVRVKRLELHTVLKGIFSLQLR